MGMELSENALERDGNPERNENCIENPDSQRPGEWELPGLRDAGELPETDFSDSGRETEELPGLAEISESRTEEPEKSPEAAAETERKTVPEKEGAEAEERGLSDREKQELKERTGWPDEIIDKIGSMKEAEIYEKAGVEAKLVGDKWCLVRKDIDWNQKDAFGRTNQERVNMKPPEGPLSPINKNGETVEVHHIGQKQDSPYAELTMQEHRGKGNDTVLHVKDKESEIDRKDFNAEKREYWKERADSMG